MRQSKRRRQEQELGLVGNNHQREQQQRYSMQLVDVAPKTFNQARTFKAFRNEKHLVLHGVPGSGKTFLSLYLALEAVRNQEFQKVIIFRSVVPSRDMGFLPGSAKEKAAVYEAPYDYVCSQLYERDDAYNVLKQKGIIDFRSTSFVRGGTIDNAVIFIDEVQNMSAHEHNSVITRVGDNCRLIFAGDYYQSDLLNAVEREGIWKTMSRLKKMEDVEFIEFEPADIVRSGFVRRWIESEWLERAANKNSTQSTD